MTADAQSQPQAAQPTELSPLDEARKLNEETKKMATTIREERERMEKAATIVQMTGKSQAGQPQAKEETPEERNKRLVNERYAGMGKKFQL